MFSFLILNSFFEFWNIFFTIYLASEYINSDKCIYSISISNYLGLKSNVSTGLLNDNNVQPGSGFRTVTGRGRGVRGKNNKICLFIFFQILLECESSFLYLNAKIYDNSSFSFFNVIHTIFDNFIYLIYLLINWFIHFLLCLFN